MQKLSIQRFSKVAALAMIAALATSSAARADIIVTYSETGGPSGGPTTLASGSPSSVGGVIYSPGVTLQLGNFTASGVGLSETQTIGLSEVLSSTLVFTNTDTSAHTIDVTVQATGFTRPIAPANLNESLSGTTSNLAGTGDSISMTSQAGTAPSAQTLSPVITKTSSFYGQNGSQYITSGLSGIYTVTQTYVITLGAKANIQITGRTDLTATPEPSTAVIAGLGALGLIGYGVRRRTAKGA